MNSVILMNYNELLETAKSLLSEQPTPISLLANASAFLHDVIADLNWAGFYLFDGDALHVGPFQGHVACATIQLGQGVCGEAALKRKTMVIGNVLTHDNHIACDTNSRSEVVIPLFLKEKLYGVLDIDSPEVGRFSEIDEQGLTFLMSEVEKLLNSHAIKA